MCGILGNFGVTTEFNWLSENINELVDRGPDNQSLAKVDDHCSLGASRLAMVDPHPRSNQPFTDGKFWLCFNGEIYNHEELRKKFKNLHTFETESDTEVLFVMLRRFGAEALTEINGMFSFAFYDSNQVKLLLGRDSLGKKPLYYSFYEGNVFFSSKRELIPREKKSDYLTGESAQYIYDYLRLGFLIDPSTPDKGHHAVEPGTVLQFELDKKNVKNGIQVKTIRGKDPINASSFASGEPSLDLRQILTEAVIARTKGHSNIGLSLSGGIDSTIVAIILRDIGISARAYSAYWPDADKARYNFDYRKAEQVAFHLNHEFSPVEVISSQEIPDQVERFLNMMQEPNNNPTGISMISIYEKMANDGVRLALTGDGGDEFFGGYSRYISYLNYKRIGWLYEVKSFLQRMNFSSEKIGSKPNKIENFKDWAYWHETFSDKEVQLLASFSSSQVEDIQKKLNLEFHKEITKFGANSLKALMYLDQHYWLSMESNRRLDRISMAFSIEARSPFQDDTVASEFSKCDERVIRSRLGKKQLIEAFPELNDLGVLEKKLGFVSPMGHWLRENEPEIQDKISFLSQIPIFTNVSKINVNSYLYSKDFKSLRQIWTLYVLAKWFVRSQKSL